MVVLSLDERLTPEQAQEVAIAVEADFARTMDLGDDGAPAGRLAAPANARGEGGL